MFDSLLYSYLIGPCKQLSLRQSHAPAGTFSRCKIKEKTFHALTKKVEIRHLSVKYHNFYGFTDYSKPFSCTFPTSSVISSKWSLNHPHTLPMTQDMSRKCFKTALNRLQEKAFPLLPNHIKREDKQPTSFSNPLSRNTPFNMHCHCNPQSQQTGKARSNGQKAQKARFHRRNTGAGGSRKADGNRFLSEKDMYAEKQTGKYTIRFTRLPTAVQANRHHLSRHPPAARYLFGPMMHCAASAIAAQCISHRSAVHRPLQRAAMSFAAQCV